MSDETKPEPKEPEISSTEPEPSKTHTEPSDTKKTKPNKLLGGLLIAVAVAAFFGGYTVATFDQPQSLTKEDLQEALADMEPTVVQAPQPQEPSAQSAPSVVMVSIDDDPVKGDPNAPVTVIEFSDFQCPFCSRFYHNTLPLLEENYIDTGIVKFVYRDLPLDSIHPNAVPAHIAAECADEQGKFWEYHDVLFSNQGQWQNLSQDNLVGKLQEYASELELQGDNFNSCMQSQDILQEINADYTDAANYGISGTPTFFIGNEQNGFVKLVGAQPYQAFEAAINAQLG